MFSLRLATSKSNCLLKAGCGLVSQLKLILSEMPELDLTLLLVSLITTDVKNVNCDEIMAASQNNSWGLCCLISPFISLKATSALA